MEPRIPPPHISEPILPPKINDDITSKHTFRWEERHFKIVEESEKMFRNHKQGDEIVI